MYFVTSDLHLEFYSSIGSITFQILKEVTSYPLEDRVIFLCGDIGYPFEPNYSKFLEFCSKNFRYVLITTGNHEYYNINDEGRSMMAIDNKIDKITSSFDNVIFLNKSYCILEEFKIIVLGSTLWSSLQPYGIDKKINDFTYIVTDESTNSNITLEEYHSLHEDHLKKLTNNIDKIADRKKTEEYSDYDLIVMTHHLPSHSLIAPQYKGSSINQFFATDLDYLFEKLNLDSKTFIKYWFCGHTHTRITSEIHGTKVIVNPYGYPGEAECESNFILYTI